MKEGSNFKIKNSENKIQHKSVLLSEVVSFLSPKSKGVYVDATVGTGGHAEKILEGSAPDGKVIGIDIDPRMLEAAKRRLLRFKDRCLLIEDNYIGLIEILHKFNIDKIDGIIFDLGVSTEHFTESFRGFSITKDGPLDMRFSPRTKLTAEEIINTWKPEKLINILYQYGEERRARRIVRYIAEKRRERKIGTTGELKELIVRAIGRSKKGKIHPATKTFQALRIAVNHELDNIKTVLPRAIDILKPGGRLCVISFHSLEDRLVKETFRFFSRSCICPPELQQCMCNNKPKVKIVTKKPVVPEEREIVSNPRARSAKLRVVERI